MVLQLPSFQSLLVRMRVNGRELATGTAFVVVHNDIPLLITNRHNVTGRHQETDKPISPTGGVPSEIEIVHNKLGSPGEWILRVEPLLNSEGQPLWKEHPTFGRQADFVALRLTELIDVQLYPYSLGATAQSGGVSFSTSLLQISPAVPVSVIGFPFGIQAGGSLAVWATGFIATEPLINFNNLPVFLVDCRARPGQSGSAVVLHSHGAVPMQGGGTMSTGQPFTMLLGIYSGRINAESDLGRVWKASAIEELVASLGPA